MMWFITFDSIVWEIHEADFTQLLVKSKLYGIFNSKVKSKFVISRMNLKQTTKPTNEALKIYKACNISSVSERLKKFVVTIKKIIPLKIKELTYYFCKLG